MSVEGIREAIRILLESSDIELIKSEMLEISDYVLGLEELIERAENISVERIDYIEALPSIIEKRFDVILTHHRNRASEDQDYFNRKIHLAVVAEVEAAQIQILEGLK